MLAAVVTAPGAEPSFRPATGEAHAAERADGVLRAVQERLVARGYPAGYPDGVWGEQSADALRQFQEDHGLPPTGELDDETAALLFAEDDELQLVAGHDAEEYGAPPAHGPAFAFGAAIGFLAAALIALGGVTWRRRYRRTAS